MACCAPQSCAVLWFGCRQRSAHILMHDRMHCVAICRRFRRGGQGGRGGGDAVCVGGGLVMSRGSEAASICLGLKDLHQLSAHPDHDAAAVLICYALPSAPMLPAAVLSLCTCFVALQVHQPGLVIHTVGYPLDSSTYGGAWIYHMDNRCVGITSAMRARHYLFPETPPRSFLNRTEPIKCTWLNLG